VTEPAEPTPSPTTLRWAVRLLLVQAAALAVLTLLLVYLGLAGDYTAARMALSLPGYVGLMTAALLGLGVALARHRRWARGPAIVLELLQVPIGFTMLSGGLPQVGAPLLISGLLGAGLLLAPATRQALGLG
jgi:hypothetical protein